MDEFDAPRADWLELWQGPMHFRATFDRGEFGPGHTIERINQLGLDGATSHGRYEPIFAVRLDPADGAIVIEWLIGLPGREPPFPTVRYYEGGPGRGLFDRLRDDPNFRNQALAHLPADQRERAVGAFACGVSIREWADAEFFQALHAGQCEIWARVGSKVAMFARIPADIFRSYSIKSWGYGQPGAAWAELDGAPSLYSIHVAPASEAHWPADKGPRTPVMRALLAEVPATIDSIGEVQKLIEAINQIAFGKPSDDAQLFLDAEGNLQICHADGSPATPESSAAKMAVYRAGLDQTVTWLRGGELPAYFIEPGKPPVAISRLHWNSVDSVDALSLYNDLPVLVSREAVLRLVATRQAKIIEVQSDTANARAPAVKAGRPPDDSAILAKADEMKERGMDGRTIAKEMRLEPGYENVATTTVRDLIKGRWKPAGRPKKAA